MYTINLERLDKLIKFLEELPEEKFDFSTVIDGCGTVCCAIGWTPKLFPDLVEYYQPGIEPDVILRSKTAEPKHGYEKVASIIFGMCEILARRLFTPNCQCYIHFDLPVMGNNASPKKVANMLKIFANFVFSGKIYDHQLSIGSALPYQEINI